MTRRYLLKHFLLVPYLWGALTSCSGKIPNRGPSSEPSLIVGELCPESRRIPRNELLVVMTFNVLKAYGAGIPVGGRLKSIHEIIRNISPDVLGLQELYRNEGQENSPNTLEDMQIPLMKSGPEWDYSYYESGMILSRGKILEHYEPTQYRRNWGALIRIKRENLDFQLRFYNVHLNYTDGGWELLSASKDPSRDFHSFIEFPGVHLRIKELKHIIDQVKNSRENIIIGGDFNSGSHLDWQKENKALLTQYPFLESAPIRWKESDYLLANGFTDSFRSVNPLSTNWGPTWSPLYKDSPRERIDYIYFKNADQNISLKPICSQVIGESPEHASLVYAGPWPSDHRALVSIFQIKRVP